MPKEVPGCSVDFCSCKIDIHAIHGARKGFASMDAGIEHGCIHPAPKCHSPSVMVNSLTNLGAGYFDGPPVPNFDLR
ncbi:MAG: hypothetical protein CVV06_06040 [Gammaproteobacteria bacterium HGW-Gammaproteobacteria-10]|nr:MAG: hypothetical protein CVV06_06040 [Gammaproteobacteria bacterium HGW-Gammaproteobacteria-10]